MVGIQESMGPSRNAAIVEIPYKSDLQGKLKPKYAFSELCEHVTGRILLDMRTVDGSVYPTYRKKFARLRQIPMIKSEKKLFLTHMHPISFWLDSTLQPLGPIVIQKISIKSLWPPEKCPRLISEQIWTINTAWKWESNPYISFYGNKRQFVDNESHNIARTYSPCCLS